MEEREIAILLINNQSKETLHNTEIVSESVGIPVIDVDDTEALEKQSISMSTSNDTEIGGIDSSIVTVIDVDSILPPDTVLGTVETISGTFLLQPPIHTTIYIRNPRMQQKLIISSLSKWHLNLHHRS